MLMQTPNSLVTIELIQGKEQQCITMNSIRVAGLKPSGGGRIIGRWITSVDNIMKAIQTPPQEEQYKGNLNT